MNLNRIKHKWKRKSLDWTFTYGKYNNCRLSFVISIDPKYVMNLVRDKKLHIDIQAESTLKFALAKIGWDQYLTN